MKLTDAERRTILDQLRDEALVDIRNAGCTCVPTLSLTEKVYGPYDLPMWQSDHGDDCALSQTAREANPDAETGMILGSSITRKLRPDA